MELYFILNGIISLATIFAMNAKLFNFRKKLYFGLFALICWLLPLHMLSTLRSSNLFIPVISELVPALFIPDLHFNKFLNISLFAWSVMGASLIGCIKFTYNYSLHKHQVTLLNKYSKTTEIQEIQGRKVRVSDTTVIKGAMTSGIFSPIIWIGHAIQDGEQREAVILHESTHIKNRDPLVLFILHFIECLMWWNPLALVVVRLAKQHIELSCDEHCKIKLGLESYKKHLAKLVLVLNESDILPMAARFSSASDNFNILRINKLAEFKPLSRIDYLKYTFTSIIVFVLIILFIRSGQTGLDGKRSNIFYPTSPTTLDIRIEQMPMRSMGLLGVYFGLERSYVHSEIRNEFYYLEMHDVTLNTILEKFSQDTIATARIIDNVLYITPDWLDNPNDFSWVTDKYTADLPSNPKEVEIREKINHLRASLKEKQKIKNPSG